MDNQFQIEYDTSGRMRIIAPDGTASEWAGYQFFPDLTWKGQTYVAFGPYYEGCMPTEMVFLLAKQDTKVVEK